jgi:hypothetical protein
MRISSDLSKKELQQSFLPTQPAKGIINSRGNVQELAKIFEYVFYYFCGHNSPFAEDYLARLKTILGLGFTSVLVDEIFLSTYQRKMDVFLRYCDFKKHQNNLVELSIVIAEMIDLAFSAFHSIGCPPYYQNFVTTINRLLNRIEVYLPKNNSDCYKLLQSLQKDFVYGKNT